MYFSIQFIYFEIYYTNFASPFYNLQVIFFHKWISNGKIPEYIFFYFKMGKSRINKMYSRKYVLKIFWK